jgi:hypothetical protein
VANYLLPRDTESERLLLGVILIETPAVRSEIVQGVQSGWFFDPWHRETFEILRMYRDLDGRKLCAAILNAAHRARWENPAAYLGRLIEDKDGNSVCGDRHNWKRYAANLERIADCRDAIVFLARKLTEAEDAGRNLVSESRTPSPQLRKQPA